MQAAVLSAFETAGAVDALLPIVPGLGCRVVSCGWGKFGNPEGLQCGPTMATP